METKPKPPLYTVAYAMVDGAMADTRIIDVADNTAMNLDIGRTFDSIVKLLFQA
jgi:hypothetical protein